MKDIRCGACGRKLASGRFIELHIKCGRCKTMNFLSVSNAKPEHHECQTMDDTREHIPKSKHQIM
jgi:phage FluMu protein Com